MAIEQGIVTRLNEGGNPPSAWVRIVRTGACESCASRNSCHVGKGGATEEVEALNPIKARVGDRIQVIMDTGSVIKATFLLYLFPILCMIAGGGLGHWVAQELGLQGSLPSVLLALAFLVAALLIVRASGRRMGARADYRPRVLRVIGREPGLSGTQGQERTASDQTDDCTTLNPHPLT